MDNKTDHDLLIEARVILERLESQFNNHLTHHFRYNIMAWAIALAALIGLFFK